MATTAAASGTAPPSPGSRSGCLRPSMPLTNASPHFSTDVVLLQRPRQLGEHLAGRSTDRPCASRTSGVSIQRHVRRSDVDAAVCDLEPQRVGEVLDAGLGRVVGRQPGRGGERRQRGHDQHVAAPLDHRRQRGAHGVEHAEHVDVDARVLNASGSTSSTDPKLRDPGVGHHDVDTAESLDGLCRRRPASPRDHARRRRPSAPDPRRARRPHPSVAPRRGRSAPAWRPWRAGGGPPPRRCRWRRR